MIILTQKSTSQIPLPTRTVITTIHKPGKPPSPMPVMHIIQYANRVQTLLQPAQQQSQTSQNQPSDQTPEGRPPSQMFISALPTLNISIPEWKQFLYSHSPNNYKTVLHGHKLAYCECTSLPELLRWFRTFYAY